MYHGEAAYSTGKRAMSAWCGAMSQSLTPRYERDDDDCRDLSGVGGTGSATSPIHIRAANLLVVLRHVGA